MSSTSYLGPNERLKTRRTRGEKRAQATRGAARFLPINATASVASSASARNSPDLSCGGTTSSATRLIAECPKGAAEGGGFAPRLTVTMSKRAELEGRAKSGPCLRSSLPAGVLRGFEASERTTRPETHSCVARRPGFHGVRTRSRPHSRRNRAASGRNQQRWRVVKTSPNHFAPRAIQRTPADQALLVA